MRKGEARCTYVFPMDPAPRDKNLGRCTKVRDHDGWHTLPKKYQGYNHAPVSARP